MKRPSLLAVIGFVCLLAAVLAGVRELRKINAREEATAEEAKRKEEFDKELDAILRRAHEPDGAAQ